jgi:uncharacterized membrane-anchored protein YitT (DUF2179 family)
MSLNTIIKKNKYYDVAFRCAIVIISNLILQLATMWFLEPAHLYSGGATGLSQLILRFIYKMSGNEYGVGNYHYFLALTIFLVNIPFLAIGWKFVSLKFALYSLLAVLIQTVVSILVPPTTSPFKDAGELTLAIMGGIVAGFACGIALKFGTSTGGIDIIAQAVALHKGISIGMFTLSANVVIAVIGGGVLQGDWKVALWTIIRIILNSLVTDKIHTAYTYSALNIFTSHDDEISQKIMRELNRGCTVMNVVGEYTHKEGKELYCVVSTYEIDTVLSIIKEFDKNAFVTITPVKRVFGNFIKKTII